MGTAMATRTAVASIAERPQNADSVSLSGSPVVSVLRRASRLTPYAREAVDGSETFPAALVHRMAIASLHDEFADVITTDEALARLQG
jgi:hypothetical protein